MPTRATTWSLGGQHCGDYRYTRQHTDAGTGRTIFRGGVGGGLAGADVLSWTRGQGRSLLLSLGERLREVAIRS